LYDEIKDNEKKLRDLPSEINELENKWKSGNEAYIQHKNTNIKPIYSQIFHRWEYLSTRVFHTLMTCGFYSLVKGFPPSDQDRYLDELNKCYSLCEEINNQTSTLENIAVSAIRRCKEYMPYENNWQITTKWSFRYIDEFKGVVVKPMEDKWGLPNCLFIDLQQNYEFVTTLNELLDKCITELRHICTDYKVNEIKFPGSDSKNVKEFDKLIINDPTDKIITKNPTLLSCFNNFSLIITVVSILTIIFVLYVDFEKYFPIFNSFKYILVLGAGLFMGSIILYYHGVFYEHCN
jgi:hypothetical protein